MAAFRDIVKRSKLTGVTLLSSKDEFEGLRSNLLWNCNECLREFNGRPNDVLKRGSCSGCNRKNIHYDDIASYLEGTGTQLLSERGEYLSGRSPLRWKCGECDKEFINKVGCAIVNKMCISCHKKNHKYSEIVRILEPYGTKMLTPKENYHNTTDNLLWECGMCGRHFGSKIKSVIESFYCDTCTKNLIPFDDIVNLCWNECGTEITSNIVDYTSIKSNLTAVCGGCNREIEENAEWFYKHYMCVDCTEHTYQLRSLQLIDDVEMVSDVKNGIAKWRCSCGNIFTRSTKNIRKNIICRSCAAKKAKNAPTYQSFIDILDKDSYIMNSGIDEYKNTKSLLTVQCPKGHEFRTSYNRFVTNGSRCPNCLIQSEYTLEDVRKIFSDKGLDLLETEYVNNKTPMMYMCWCENKARIALSNLMRIDFIGCNNCRNAAKRTDWDTILETFVNEGCELLTPQEDYKNNTQPLRFICKCGNTDHVSWKAFRQGTRCKLCSSIRREETNKQRYGFPNPAQSEQVKQKIRTTFMSKYGVDHNMKTDKSKKKGMVTNMNNNGGSHNLRNPAIREKGRQQRVENYRGEYFESDDYKNYMVETYGVEYCMQNPDIAEKSFKKSVYKKIYTFPSGRQEHVQGYEPFAIDHLLSEYSENDIYLGKNVPRIKYEDKNGKSCVYYPDIYIPTTNTLIEVKSKHTMNINYNKNIIKFQAAAKEGYRFLLWIFDSDGTFLEEREFFNSELNFVQ